MAEANNYGTICVINNVGTEKGHVSMWKYTKKTSRFRSSPVEFELKTKSLSINKVIVNKYGRD